MGPIVDCERKDGSVSYRTQIVIKSKGRIVHQESSSFDRRTTAKTWLTRRENDHRAPGALDAARRKMGTVGNVIPDCLKAKENNMGKQKASFSGRSRMRSPLMKFSVISCGPSISPTLHGASQ